MSLPASQNLHMTRCKVCVTKVGQFRDILSSSQDVSERFKCVHAPIEPCFMSRNMQNCRVYRSKMASGDIFAPETGWDRFELI